MKKIVMLSILAISLAVAAMADIPKTINYQGRLTDSTGNILADGTYSVAFRLWTHPTSDDEGTYRVWNDSYQVPTKNGYFSIELGSGLNTLDSLDFNTTYYLDMQVGTDEFMAPRHKLNSAAYAMNVADGAIITDKIADNAVTNKWIETDIPSKNWNTFGSQQILSQEITLTKDATVVAFAKCNYALVTGATASVCQFHIDMEGMGGDNGENSINTGTPSAMVNLIGTAILTAGTHTITLNINPISISPSGESIRTNRHVMVVMVFYK